MPFEFPPADPNDYRGVGVIVCGVLTIAIATGFVAARFYSRAVLLHTVGWEDWLILVALFFSYGTSAGMIAQLHYGLGRHMQFVLDKIPQYVAAGIFTSLLYTLSLTFTKISILCLYIRILTYDKLRLLGKILLGVVIVSHLWIVITILITTVPLQAFWDWSVKAKFTMPPMTYWGNSALNMVTDFLIFCLPLPVIFRLRIARRQKIGIYFVFLVAFAVCVISLVRLVWLIDVYEESKNSFYDICWEGVAISKWTMAEVNTAIVCACLTTLRPLLTRFFPRVLLSPQDSMQEPGNQPDMIDGYERPLTIGRRPNRRNTVEDTENSSINLHEPELPAAESESDLSDSQQHRQQTTSLRDLEAQIEGDTLREIETGDFEPPPKCQIRNAESHDSLRRYSSTPVSQHRGL